MPRGRRGALLAPGPPAHGRTPFANSEIVNCTLYVDGVQNVSNGTPVVPDDDNYFFGQPSRYCFKPPSRSTLPPRIGLPGTQFRQLAVDYSVGKERATGVTLMSSI